jgi:GT2 family glycosyltransferase
MGEPIGEYIKIAIVILNWNGRKFLEQFLPELIKNSNRDDVRIFIADNGSSDSSVKFLRENYPNIQLILFDNNAGFAGGYNRALEHIDARYFILLNSDVEVSPNWIHPVIEYMDDNQEVAAVQPKIRSYSQREYFEYAGAAGGFIDKYGFPFCRGRILKEHEKDNGQYNKISDIFWATGACMFIRADLFKKAGGFDEDFFAHMEEIDLCWRLKNMGYRIVYHPESTIFHVGGGTLPNNNPHKLYLNYRNNLFLLYKNLPTKHRFRTVLIRMMLDGASAFIYLINFSFSFFWAVFKAHLHFYLSIGSLRKKRRILSTSFNVFMHNEIYRKSIVKGYYLFKIRKFSNLKF